MLASELNQHAFADASPETMKKVQDLILLVKTGDDIKAKQDSIKQDILPQVQELGIIESGDRAVIYVDGSKGLTINRQAIKDAIMRKFNMSEMAAEAVLAEASKERLINPYIKIMSRENFLKQKTLLESMRKAKEAKANAANPPAVNTSEVK